MNAHRPGFALGNRGEELRIYIDKSCITASGSLTRSDIVVTVNELTSLGEIKLGVCKPESLLVKEAIEPEASKLTLNRLCLSRAVGTSIVIRKKDGIHSDRALRDLRKSGIYISNSTPSLQTAGHKTGASLVFHANESIWKVLRLELTLLRGIQQ